MNTVNSAMNCSIKTCFHIVNTGAKRHAAADEFVKMNEGHLFHYSGQQIPKHFTLVQYHKLSLTCSRNAYTYFLTDILDGSGSAIAF